MDNLCHTLAGAVLGEAGLKHRTRYAHAVLMVSANVPDLDVLVFFADISPVSFRRGWTHGLAAQLLLPVGVALLFSLLDRCRQTKGTGAPPIRAGWLLALAYVGVASHVGLDLLNNYGIRLLAPFDWRWFYGDAVFIVDPWLWLLLAGGIWIGRSRWCATAGRPAQIALMAAACYIVAMVVSARAARAIVADEWRQRHGRDARALMVGPAPITPFRRVVIVDAGDRYETGTFTWVPTAVVFDPRPIPKNAGRPEVRAARAQSRAIREFLVWSRFPFWIVEQSPERTRVVVGDMRFRDVPTSTTSRFSASVVLPRRSSPESPQSP